MNFIYIWHDGRYRFKVLLREIPILGRDLEIEVTDLEFSYESQTFCIEFTQLYYQDPLIDFINIWHDGIHRFKAFLSTIPKLGHGFVLLKL